MATHKTRKMKNKKALKTRKHRGAGLGNLFKSNPFKSEDAKMRDALIQKYGLNNKDKIIKDIKHGILNKDQLKEINEKLDTLLERNYQYNGKRLLTNNQRMNFNNIRKEASIVLRMGI